MILFVPYHKASDTWLFELRGGGNRQAAVNKFLAAKIDRRSDNNELVRTGERRYMTKSFVFWQNIGWEIIRLEAR